MYIMEISSLLQCDCYDDRSIMTTFLCTLFSGSIKEKKEDLEEKPEMSKNAQFRAIKPSPSILSFVEDNVIWMSRDI